MKHYGMIYKIFVKETGQIVYIGQTCKTLRRRFNEHYKAKGNTIIGKAMRKYGKEYFDIEQLASCFNQESLDATEKYLIKYYHTQVSEGGYNIEWGGNKRGKTSDEVRKHMSENNTRKRRIIAVNIETREQIEFESGVATAKYLGTSNGNVHEACKRDSKLISLKNHILWYKEDSPKNIDEIIKRKDKRISIYGRNTATGEFKKFDSIKDAAAYVNMPSATISTGLSDRCVQNRWKFWYAHKEEPQIKIAHRQLAVWCKNLATKEKYKFNSTTEMGEFLKINRKAIAATINQKKARYGWVFWYDGEEEPKGHLKMCLQIINIIAINDATGEIRHYKTIKECAMALGCRNSEILSALRGTRGTKKARGWFITSENQPIAPNYN